MHGTLPELLDHARREHASRPAVEDPDTNSSLTYAELGALADEIALSLRESGVKRGDRVGICAPKSIETVAAIHGILGAGAAYVPVDTASPPKRNAGIFADCAASAIVVDTALLDGLVAAGLSPSPAREICESLSLVTLASDQSAGESGESVAGPDDLAYILYTSGSTGRPKGVVHTHRSARAFVDWCSATFTPTPDDRFSSHAPFHFDLSILDLFVSAAAGAPVILIGDDTGKQPVCLASLISERRITIWYSTPSALRLLSGYGKIGAQDHSSLRLVLFAGEVFPIGALHELRRQWPWPRYFNLYGPTETNVCTFLELPIELDENRATPYSIGHVCAGDKARVVDEHNRDVSPGQEGELQISGPTVMRGYWNLPERTAGAFVEEDEVRWYRTGDIVRDSEVEGFVFLGRRDRMVKRRGFRVELGEIEAALALHPDVLECAVIAKPDDTSGVRIDAAIVARTPAKLSLVELKQFSAARLPLYMVPDRFTFLDSIPQTSTGKIDYQRLMMDRQ